MLSSVRANAPSEEKQRYILILIAKWLIQTIKYEKALTDGVNEAKFFFRANSKNSNKQLQSHV